MKIVTLCNSNHFKYVRLQAETVWQYEKNARHIIYDIGLDWHEIEELKLIPTVVVKKFDDIGKEYFATFDKFPDSELRRDGGKAIITRSSAKKTWCLQAELEEDNQIVYLDADAFLCRDISHVFQGEWNIMVTLRRQQNAPVNALENSPHWHFRLFNAGVQFFWGSWRKLNTYFEEFKVLLNEMPRLSDQGNLNRFATKYAGFLFTEMYKSYKIKVRGEEMIFRVIPCTIYNRMVDRGSNIDRVAIAHIKGLAKNRITGTYKDILKHFTR